MATKKTGSLKGVDVVLVTSVNLATSDVTGVLPVENGGTGTGSFTNGQLLIGNTTGNTLVKSALTGTANQVIVTNGAGAITLSLPQSIAVGSTPTFASVAITAGGETRIPFFTATKTITSNPDLAWDDTNSSLLVSRVNGLVIDVVGAGFLTANLNLDPASTITFIGAYASTIRSTAITDVTLPTSGTLLSSVNIGSTVQAYDADLDAIAALATTGMVARTGAGTAAARTITGTANQVTVVNGDGVSGNPTLSLPQSIAATSSPTFAQVIVQADAGTGITASRFSTNTGGPNFTLQKARGTIAAPADAAAGDVAFNLLAQGYDALAFRTVANLQGRCATGFGGGDSPGLWAFQTTPVGSYVQQDVVLFDSAGNVQLVVAGTLNAAAVDVVSMVGVDNGAGNRELQIQPESGGYLAYGADVLRRIPNANRGVDDRIKSVTTIDATVTTVDTIAITASSTYLIETRVTARRTGGVSGTADDGASYVRRATYTTKATIVTLLGTVQVIGTDAEDQAAWDVTMTISGANVLVRVTGAASNNISWQAATQVNRVAS